MQWERENGYPEDVTMQQLKEIAEKQKGLTGSIEKTVTVDAIRRHLAAGEPVIVPAAGRDLGNPYFSGEGPWYHNLVIIGYEPGYFITNDPGTKRGGQYRYREDVLLEAIHDWTGVKEEIRGGGRAMLVMRKG